MKFILLQNVKMPTIVGIVGILTLNSMINTTYERQKAINFFIYRFFSFYEQLYFMLSSVEHEKSFITTGPGGFWIARWSGSTLFSICLLAWCLTLESTTMVMSGQSVHITILFPSASLTKCLTSFVHILSLVTDNNPAWISKRETSGHRNYFMNNLCKKMGLSRNQTRNPWICSQTCICSQIY